jgi:cell division protein FtsB
VTFVYLAAESSGNLALDQLLPFLNLGIIVVLVGLIMTKTGLVPKWVLDDAIAVHDRETADLKAQITELKADNDKLADTMLTQAIPALTEANRLSAQWVEMQNRRAFGGGS